MRLFAANTVFPATMKSIQLAAMFTLFLTAASVHGQTPAVEVPATEAPIIREAPPPLFNFNLIPKPFQRNPQLEMTVFTELTAHGRSLPKASAEHPLHFIAQDQGFRPMGDGVGGQRPPLPAELEGILQKALAEQGYLPFTSAARSPDLVLIYYWGSHYRLDLEMARMFPEMHRQHLLERAVLVGGRAFASDIELQLNFGYLPSDRSLKKGYLFQQADTDLYYVVVSAYDHASVIANAPKLAWRTTMTVNAIGVAMKESLPPLILTAGPWFGREMNETVALRRTVRRGTVILGPLQVIEDEPAPATRK